MSNTDVYVRAPRNIRQIETVRTTLRFHYLGISVSRQSSTVRQRVELSCLRSLACRINFSAMN